jgi:Ig domain of plant-specific actin-binding protein
MTSVLRRHPRTLLLLLAVTVAFTATTSSAAAAAGAHQMRVFVCHGPSGEAALQEDWAIGALNRVGWMYAEDTCSAADQGYLRAALGANPGGFAGYPNEPYISWTYTSPGWADIASFQLEVAGSYAYPADGGGIGEAWVEDSEKTDPNYDLRNLGGGTWGPVNLTDEAKGTMTSFQLLAACDGGSGACPANTPISSIEVTGGNILLNDLTTPAATITGGSLAEPGEIGGTSEISFHATDSDGPGIYSAQLEIDGTPQPAVNISETSSLCHNLQPAAPVPAFDATHPCPSQLDSSLTLNTALLKDGAHTVKLYVQDAAGASTLAWSATIHTNNAPTITASPVIAGTAQVGSTLSASNGSYTAPVSAGSLSNITGQWLRCTDEQAQHCSIIAGANSQTYTPTTADTGYHLVYQNTISDTDGTTTADSAPTTPITNPSTGTSSASSDSTSGLPPVTINLPQDSLTADNNQLGSPTTWSLSLHVQPTRVHKHTRITLTGEVHTHPLPAQGKIVDLQARWVHTRLITQGVRHHLQTTYGRWKVFAALRTNSKGVFSYTYTFKEGGRHTYQMEAVAPSEGGYANASGHSRVQLIHES